MYSCVRYDSFQSRLIYWREIALPRPYQLIMVVICILIFQGATAINIHFSASSGGQTVGIVDSYDIDDSVGVSGKASASFGGGVSIDESNSLWGSGSAIIKQAFYGCGGGADYVICRALSTLEASKIAGSGSSSLTPTAGKVSSTLSTTGSLETASELWGVQGGDIAGVGSGAFLADISTSQSVATGGSVAASQKMSADGLMAWAYAGAVDADWNYAGTYAGMEDGTLATVQGAKAGKSATAGQTTKIEAKYGWASSYAWDADWNVAGTYAEMEDGNLATVQGAQAGNSATAGQITEIEAEWGYAGSWASDADWNYAETYAGMEDGNLATVQGAQAGDSAAAGQMTEIEAEYGWAGSEAWDNDRKYAGTYAEIEDGTLFTLQGAEADDGARAGQWTWAEGGGGWAGSRALDADGNYVVIYAGVMDGSLDTLQVVEAANSAEGFQDTVIEGKFAYAFCEAYNPNEVYYAYVDNWIDGNAYLEFEGEAAVDGDEARAHQRSYAEGDDIWPWMNSTNLNFDGFRNSGSCNVESRAWTAANEEGLIMYMWSV